MGRGGIEHNRVDEMCEEQLGKLTAIVDDLFGVFSCGSREPELDHEEVEYDGTRGGGDGGGVVARVGVNYEVVER
jgi:hypothetical protein